MLTGLDILLARMKTNPEEFLNERGTVPYEGEMFGGKWSDLLDYAWRVADKDEREMLETARREFYRDDFNERVFKRLTGEEMKQELSPYIVKQNAAQAMKNPLLNAAQNSVLQGGMYDPNLHGYLTTTTGGFQAAETKQEGAPIGGMGNGFWGGVVASGKGKLW